MPRRLNVGLLTVIALCATGTTAAAQTPSASFTCRGSVAAITLGDQTIDPLVANNANDPCRNDGATVPSLDAHDALGPDSVDAKSQTAFAVTNLANEGGPTYGQMAGSQAGVENLDLNLGGGALHITAQGVYATAGAKCSAPNGAAEFPTYVKLVGLTVNDQPVVGGEDASIPLSSALTSGFDQFSDSPLGVVTVRTEKVYATSTGVTVEAARIELLSASGAPVVTVVLGSAKAGLRGEVCKNNADGIDVNGTSGEQCNDGLDNDGDGKIDAADPACHTDGNASNAASYDPAIASEGVNTNTATTGSGSNGTSTSGGSLGAKITLLNYVKGNLRLVKTGVKTRAKGEFMMITPNNYTTRRLVFSYRAFLNRPKVAARSKLRIIVFKNGRVVR